jgi:hypothetical protein
MKDDLELDFWEHGDGNNLTIEEVTLIDITLNHFRRWEPQQLKDEILEGQPWQEARRGLKMNDRGNSTISTDMMWKYHLMRAICYVLRKEYKWPEGSW